MDTRCTVFSIQTRSCIMSIMRDWVLRPPVCVTEKRGIGWTPCQRRDNPPKESLFAYHSHSFPTPATIHVNGKMIQPQSAPDKSTRIVVNEIGIIKRSLRHETRIRCGNSRTSPWTLLLVVTQFACLLACSVV